MDINSEIAVKVLGWEIKHGQWYEIDHRYQGLIGEFNPSSDIGQCFEYVVPAMRERGFGLSLCMGVYGVEAIFHKSGFIGSYKAIIDDPTKAALAITTAAIKAAKAMEGRDD